MKVLCLGSICLDILIQNIENMPRPNQVSQVDDLKILGGGGALNTAIALKRLGVDSYPFGEIGLDYAGYTLLKIMEDEHLNTSQILQKNGKKSSVVAVLINTQGERSFICNPGNYIHITLEEINWHKLKDFNVFLVGSCFLLPELLPVLSEPLKLCREYGVISIVDTVWPQNESAKSIVHALPYIDYFTPSFEEAQIISGQQTPQDIAQWCLDNGSTNIIIKMDKQGCYLANKDMQLQIPAITVNLVDSTGAGDCFLAGFITGLSKNYDLIKAAQLANSAGAMCVTTLGAYTGITNFDDLFNNFFSKNY